MIGTAWEGNIAVPVAGIVVDGYLMFPLAGVRPTFRGALAYPQQDYEDDDGYMMKARAVPPDRVWDLWDRTIAAPQVAVTWSRSARLHVLPLLVFRRADGLECMAQPALWALLVAAVALDRITQAGGQHDALVAWAGNTPLAVCMPMRVPADGLSEWIPCDLPDLAMERPAPTSPEAT